MRSRLWKSDGLQRGRPILVYVLRRRPRKSPAKVKKSSQRVKEPLLKKSALGESTSSDSRRRGEARLRREASSTRGSIQSGVLASMMSTPSAAEAARAREQMMDMGFPKEWCDVALRRCRYNVELAINLCFEHGSEMNQLVAEEAAVHSARSSRLSSSGFSSDPMSVLERLSGHSLVGW